MLYLLAFALSFLVESMVEYILGTPMDKIEAAKPFKWLLMYAAAVVGVGLAFWYKLDLISEITGQVTTVGIVLTGLTLGRGSNYVHDFYQAYIQPKLFREG